MNEREPSASPRAASALRSVRTRWDEERAERALPRVRQRIRRRRAARLGAAGLTGSALLLGWMLWTPADPEAITLQDGSVVTPLRASTQFDLAHEREDDTFVRLSAGAARFDVARRPTRRFRVRAGEVEVTVLGTVFDVARDSTGNRVSVSVTRGRVGVSWPGGAAELGAGESGAFPPSGAPIAERTPEPVEAAQREEARADGEARAQAEDSPASPVEGDDVEPGTPAGRATSAGTALAAGRWRRLAQAHDFEGAYQELRRAGARDTVEDLLLAADTARRAGHAREAIQYLERVEQRHAQDPRSAAAAFTRGRLLLGVGDAASAGRAFATARRLAPSGPLAADALAREAEAAARAGSQPAARDLAGEYLRRFPEGARREAMTALVR